MRLILPHRLLAGLWCGCFSLVFGVASLWDSHLVTAPTGGDVLYAQQAEEAEETGDAQQEGQSRTYQRLRHGENFCSADYGFIIFNRDFLTLHFQVSRVFYDAYVAAWGYREADLKALRAWHQTARQAAFKSATARGETQAQFDAETKALQARYDQKVADYMASKSFKFL
jgi:hypothetical protein